MRFPLALLSLALALPATPCAQSAAPAPAALAALLDSLVPAALAAERIPGAVVSVVFGGRIILARGYGVSDLESRRPMSAESTVVRIGSISKVMTATAVAQL